jgi:hypothetical protein
MNKDLPERTQVTKKYTGKTRIVATTNQSVLRKGEDFNMRIRVLSVSDSISGKIFYRVLGESSYSSADINRMASHVFEVHIPANSVTGDFEYYIRVEAGPDKVVYPVTAVNMNNVVVII